MKRILSVLAVMAVACSAFAQGSINFSSPASSLKYSSPNQNSPAVNVPAAGGFVSALWAPTGSAMTPWTVNGGQNLAAWLTANPLWKQVMAADGTTPFSKAVAGGRVLATTITVPTTAAVDLILIGWTGTATTFDAAYANAAEPSTQTVGFSDKVTVTPTTAPSPPAVVSFAGGITMTPTAVPEPSTFALAGLGAAALMIFRRRR